MIEMKIERERRKENELRVRDEKDKDKMRSWKRQIHKWRQRTRARVNIYSYKHKKDADKGHTKRRNWLFYCLIELFWTEYFIEPAPYRNTWDLFSFTSWEYVVPTAIYSFQFNFVLSFCPVCRCGRCGHNHCWPIPKTAPERIPQGDFHRCVLLRYVFSGTFNGYQCKLLLPLPLFLCSTGHLPALHRNKLAIKKRHKARNPLFVKAESFTLLNDPLHNCMEG